MAPKYQIAWLSIGIASWRFRKSWVVQSRYLSEVKFRANWTWPWGAPFIVFSVSLNILFQGWSSLYPAFSFIDFISLYLELPVMAIMTFAWYFIRHRKEFVHSHHPISSDMGVGFPTIQSVIASKHTSREVVDVDTVDLYEDEHFDDEHDAEDDALHAARRKGRWGWFWRLYDIMA
ncbi:ALP1_1 [Sanghuangporus vaninii]